MRKQDSSAWAAAGHKARYARAGIKSKYNALPETDDPAAINKQVSIPSHGLYQAKLAHAAQVSFYFSDTNLGNDKYLFGLVGGCDNKPVPVKTIHSFKRMLHFQPYAKVVEALRANELLVIDGDEGAETIQRKTPLPAAIGTKFDPDVSDVISKKSVPLTIYAKGFGAEDEQTQLDIEAYFQQFDGVTCVRLRRQHPSKWFKGSAFVEFESAALQQQFLDLETKPQYKGDLEISFQSKKAYTDQKDVDAAQRKADIKDGKIPEGSNWKERRNKFQKSSEYKKGQGEGHRGKQGDRDNHGGRNNHGRGRGGKPGRYNRDRTSTKSEESSEPKAKVAYDDEYVLMFHHSLLTSTDFCFSGVPIKTKTEDDDSKMADNGAASTGDVKKRSRSASVDGAVKTEDAPAKKVKVEDDGKGADQE